MPFGDYALAAVSLVGMASFPLMTKIVSKTSTLLGIANATSFTIDQFAFSFSLVLFCLPMTCLAIKRSRDIKYFIIKPHMSALRVVKSKEGVAGYMVRQQFVESRKAFFKSIEVIENFQQSEGVDEIPIVELRNSNKRLLKELKNGGYFFTVSCYADPNYWNTAFNNWAQEYQELMARKIKDGVEIKRIFILENSDQCNKMKDIILSMVANKIKVSLFLRDDEDILEDLRNDAKKLDFTIVGDSKGYLPWGGIDRVFDKNSDDHKPRYIINNKLLEERFDLFNRLDDSAKEIQKDMPYEC